MRRGRILAAPKIGQTLCRKSGRWRFVSKIQSGLRRTHTCRTLLLRLDRDSASAQLSGSSSWQSASWCLLRCSTSGSRTPCNSGGHYGHSQSDRSTFAIRQELGEAPMAAVESFVYSLVLMPGIRRRNVQRSLPGRRAVRNSPSTPSLKWHATYVPRVQSSVRG
jgi:hypothetical protein